MSERKPIPKAIRRYIFARDGYRCMLRMPGCLDGVLSGVALIRVMEIDHIKSLKELGYQDDSPSNLQVACRSCNRSKGTGIDDSGIAEAIAKDYGL